MNIELLIALRQMFLLECVALLFNACPQAASPMAKQAAAAMYDVNDDGISKTFGRMSWL